MVKGGGRPALALGEPLAKMVKTESWYKAWERVLEAHSLIPSEKERTLYQPKVDKVAAFIAAGQARAAGSLAAFLQTEEGAALQENLLPHWKCNAPNVSSLLRQCLAACRGEGRALIVEADAIAAVGLGQVFPLSLLLRPLLRSLLRSHQVPSCPLAPDPGSADQLGLNHGESRQGDEGDP